MGYVTHIRAKITYPRTWRKRSRYLLQERKGPTLSRLGKQTAPAAACIDLVETVVRVQACVTCLQRHYALFKAAVEEGAS